MTQSDSCPLWGFEYPATVCEDQSRSVLTVCSTRTGGHYRIADGARSLTKDLTDRQRARLTTWLVEQRSLGEEAPLITKEKIRSAKARRSLEPYQSAQRLLKWLARRSSSIGEPIPIPWDRLTDIACEAMASAELRNLDELMYLLSDYLPRRGWGFHTTNVGYGVTVDGYIHLEDLGTERDLAQAFVAMWFDESMDRAFENGIEPAVRNAGYVALRIDRKEHVNKIDDEIIGEIRRSRFLVADFTQGDAGARGSVYYEAGFARGLGLDVIYSCRKDKLKHLAFDTSHFNHLVWTKPRELRQGLEKRILAVIGEGPMVTQQG